MLVGIRFKSKWAGDEDAIWKVITKNDNDLYICEVIDSDQLCLYEDIRLRSAIFSKEQIEVSVFMKNKNGILTD